MRKSLLYCMFLTLMFVSCRKETDSIFLTKGEKLVATYLGKEKIRELLYDAEGRLIADRSKYNYYAYAYHQDDRLVAKKLYIDQNIFSSSSALATQALNRTEWVSPQNTKLSGELTYTFDASQRLIRSGELIGTSTYEYDEEGRAKVRKVFLEGRLSGCYEYFYDKRGNLTQKDQYTFGNSSVKRLSSRTNYAYDEMKSPYFRLLPDGVPGDDTSPNNVIRQKYTVYDYPENGDVSVQSDISYSYNYNEKGYPSERNDGIRFQYGE
jgi:YD repeat-containing protein